MFLYAYFSPLESLSSVPYCFGLIITCMIVKNTFSYEEPFRVPFSRYFSILICLKSISCNFSSSLNIAKRKNHVREPTTNLNLLVHSFPKYTRNKAVKTTNENIPFRPKVNIPAYQDIYLISFVKIFCV